MEDANFNHAALYQHIGGAIAARRSANGVSQAHLAKAVGLTRTSISNIENGRQKMLIHTLVDIARVLEVNPTAFLPAPEQAIKRTPRKSRKSSDESAFRFSGSDVSAAEYATISALVQDIQGRTPTSTRKGPKSS